MEANEIRKNGKLVKTWKQMDGSWYEDSYEIWQVGDKYYQIKNHECVSFSGTGSYWGRVTEVVMNTPHPTHVGLIIGQDKGRAYIYRQMQGTPEELSEWAVEVIKKEGRGYRGEDRHLIFKMMKLNFEL